MVAFRGVLGDGGRVSKGCRGFRGRVSKGFSRVQVSLQPPSTLLKMTLAA